MTSSAQNSTKLQQIDSLVKVINQSNITPQYDTIVQDMPQMGLFMKTYLTMIAEGSELKKYVNKVVSTRQENGETKNLSGQNTFYFSNNKLIKVEEYLIASGDEKHADWYYWNEKPLYYTFKSEKSEERAVFLLTTSKTMIDLFQRTLLKK